MSCETVSHIGKPEAHYIFFTVKSADDWFVKLLFVKFQDE